MGTKASDAHRAAVETRLISGEELPVVLGARKAWRA